MLNDTYAVTDLNVLNVDTYHKIRARSVGRASVLQDAGSDLNSSFRLFFFFFVLQDAGSDLNSSFRLFFFFFFFFLLLLFLLLSF